MDSTPETPTFFETNADLHRVPSETTILEFVEKVENLSLFQDRIEKPSRMPQVWDALREEIERQITPAAVSLFLVDQQTHAFELNHWAPNDCEALCRQEIDAQIECGTFAWIVNRRQPAVIPALLFKNHQSLVMLPLATHARTLGVAMIVTTIEENTVTLERLRLLGILSKQCALVMENTFLYDQLEREHQALQTAQTQIIQAEKFASQGRLTSGAFHELLNPLNIISGHIQLMMMDQNLKAPYPDYLSLMKNESDRIATIVNSLLRFTSKQPKDFQKVDIVQLLKQAIDEKSASRSSGQVNVEFLFDDALPQTMAHEDDLKTVIIHLLDNAYDAMPEGGTLQIGARHNKAGSDKLKNTDFIEISIADDGCGITETDTHKVFDPFFTTKDIGDGMGLSLAMSYALITSMGGTITFDSQEDQGTVFTVGLPVNTNKS